MDNLETKVITAGLKTSIGDQPIPTFPDFTEEIKQHKRKKLTLPFVNQKQSFLKLARALSTNYPYAVLVGDSGVGKSLILDYVLDILTDQTNLTAIKKEIPEAVPLLEDIKIKVENYQHTEHMLLANLFDPMRVYTISYTDVATGTQDDEVAQEFAGELGTLLENYGDNNRERIRRTMSKKNFEKQVEYYVGQIYYHTYKKTRENLILHDENNELSAKHVQNLLMDKIISLIQLTIPDNYEESSTITGTWEIHSNIDVSMLKHVAGFNDLRQDITKEEIEYGLAHSILPVAAQERYNEILAKIARIDVEGVTDDNYKYQVLKSKFEDYNKFSFEVTRGKINNGDFKTQQDVITYIDSQIKPFYPKSRVSKSTIDDVKSQIYSTCEEYMGREITPELKQWIKSVKQYFTSDDEYLKSSLDQILYEIDMIDEGFKKPKSSKADGEKEQKSNRIGFSVNHGRYAVNISDILEPNYIEDSGSEQNSWTKVGDMSSEGLFAHFEKYCEDNAPHALLTELGSFFKSGILVFKDSFGDFISFLTNDENKKTSLKEQFLEYLQTGTMTLVHDGITYELKAPQIILGCDNDDPFTSIKGLFPKDEIGLRARIQTIVAENFTDNTPETRLGTIKVLYDTLRKYNVENGKEISISNDAANILLQQMIPIEGYMSLKYRDFTKTIDDVCSYAVSKGVNKVDSQLLKDKTKDELPAGFFARINSEKSVGGFFDNPEKSKGYVNGLAVSDQGSSIVKIRSYTIDEECGNFRESAFSLHDSSADMADKDTIKGFQLAKDYLLLKLKEAGVSSEFLNSNQRLNSFIADYWGGISGPSATLAFTLSMMSALTEEEMYKNRFVTGTLNSATGQVGTIGGTYRKGLVPMRLRELSDENEHMYFLFPAGNLVDFSKDLATDPFNVTDKVGCFPIKTFEQAYHLFTCGPTISERDWHESQELGTKKLESTLSKLKGKYNSCKD